MEETKICHHCKERFSMLFRSAEDYVYKDKNGFNSMVYFCSYKCRQEYRRLRDERKNKARCFESCEF